MSLRPNPRPLRSFWRSWERSAPKRKLPKPRLPPRPRRKPSRWRKSSRTMLLPPPRPPLPNSPRS
ncbi:MAG: hypothetical protein EBS91_11855 [Betaproteobacteria bacterium]|nr:hypothetical protein [Betaproteobacteria bacterium]